MRNLSFKEIMESELFGTNVDELEGDLMHVCRARNGSGPTTEMMLARIAAEAIFELKQWRKIDLKTIGPKATVV